MMMLIGVTIGFCIQAVSLCHIVQSVAYANTYPIADVFEGFPVEHLIKWKMRNRTLVLYTGSGLKAPKSLSNFPFLPVAQHCSSAMPMPIKAPVISSVIMQVDVLATLALCQAAADSDVLQIGRF